jgi:hypothetical protein
MISPLRKVKAGNLVKTFHLASPTPCRIGAGVMNEEERAFATERKSSTFKLEVALR